MHQRTGCSSLLVLCVGLCSLLSILIGGRGLLTWLVGATGLWLLVPQQGIFTSYSYFPQQQTPARHIVAEPPEEVLEKFIQETSLLPREDANFLDRRTGQQLPRWTTPARFPITWQTGAPAVEWYSIRYLADGRHEEPILVEVKDLDVLHVKGWTANVHKFKEFWLDTSLNVRAVVTANVTSIDGERRIAAFVLVPSGGEYYVFGPPSGLEGWRVVALSFESSEP
jgi:hypothetical protein